MVSKLLTVILGLLLGFLGINACIGGLLLMIQPDGGLLAMQSNWLIDSPFQTYFIPGLLLFIFPGLVPLLSLWGILKPAAFGVFEKLNLFPDKHWSWAFSIYAALIAQMWIMVQQILTRYFWIQSLILVVAWLILVLCLSQALEKRFSVPR